jgi:molybdopterin-guanine dinucleotide biosynthesis protein A
VIEEATAFATAVVLAGGRSRRFGSPKLEAPLDGRPMLEHVLRVAAEVCPQTLVVRSSADPALALPPELSQGVELVVDEHAYEGPLAAAVGAAAHARGDRLLLLAGDMPWVVAGVLRQLLEFPSGREGACLLDGGARRPLPLALGRAALLGHGTALLDAGERSLQALLRRADLEAVAEDAWRGLDPDGLSLRDVDRPEDL